MLDDLLDVIEVLQQRIRDYGPSLRENVAGHRIGSAEVESALVSHPQVAEAAVIGKPDELRGEVIKGFVTLRMGSEGSDRMVNALQLHVRRELGPIAVPSEIESRPRCPKPAPARSCAACSRRRSWGWTRGT